MATTKISQLPAASAIVATDLVPMVDDPAGTAVTQKATWSQARDYALGISGGVATIAEDMVFTGDIGQNAAPQAEASTVRIVKNISSIANGVATTIATITIPNGAHSAGVFVQGLAWIGAGGAIGAHEGAQAFTRTIVLTRTAGVGTTSSSDDVTGGDFASTNVAGGTAVTLNFAPAAASGGVGATQTVALQATISRGSGSSTNHRCICTIELINAESSGISIA